LFEAADCTAVGDTDSATINMHVSLAHACPAPGKRACRPRCKIWHHYLFSLSLPSLWATHGWRACPVLLIRSEAGLVQRSGLDLTQDAHLQAATSTDKLSSRCDR